MWLLFSLTTVSPSCRVARPEQDLSTHLQCIFIVTSLVQSVLEPMEVEAPGSSLCLCKFGHTQVNKTQVFTILR